MPKITDIAVQKRRKDRYSISIDGKFELSLSENQLLDAGLRIGDEITDDHIEQLRADSEFGKALDRTYNYVSYRMRSRYEVVTYLRGKQYDDELAQDVISELERRRIIDDERFAREWIDMRQLESPRSRRQLSSELKQKGIANETIEIVLAELLPEDTAESVMALIEQKRLRHRYDDERKLIQYLAGKGFHYQTIKDALERLGEN